MSLLQNRFFVGAAVVAALGLVAYSLVPTVNQWRSRSTTATKSGAILPSPGGVGGSASGATNMSAKGTAAAEVPTIIRIEQDSVLARVSDWLERPEVDPFLAVKDTVKGAVLPSSDKPKTAAEMLSLTAVWRQTGHRLAVINQVVVHEGDQIGDYTLLEVAPDAIRVHGPLGEEQVTFGQGPGKGTNAVPAAVKKG